MHVLFDLTDRRSWAAAEFKYVTFGRHVVHFLEIRVTVLLAVSSRGGRSFLDGRYPKPVVQRAHPKLRLAFVKKKAYTWML